MRSCGWAGRLRTAPTDPTIQRRVACAALLLVVFAIGGCGAGQDGAAALKFTLTEGGCVPSQGSVAAGPVTISVTNGGSPHVTELELRNTSGIVIGERENLLPGLSGSFSLDLQPGTYVIACPDGGSFTQGFGKLTVTGKPHPVRGPSEVLLKTAVLQYRTYVEGQATQLLEGTRRFVTAIDQRDMAAAKRLYGPVRIHYEAIEPVSESFPNLDTDIDARIDSPQIDGDVAKWEGFHRIEQLMWAKHTLAGVPRLANRLLGNVETLQRRIPTLPLEPEQLVNGSVGLLNEIVNVKITGEEDRYSHTDLSDFQGNLTGATKAFEDLRSSLERDGQAALAARVAVQLAAVQRELDAYRRGTPLGFALYGALTTADKQRIAQQVGDAAQELSTVALKLSETG